MIRYTLTCKAEHGFESWFQSAAAFTALQAAGHLSCPICGATEVEKALMAPALVQARPSATAGDQTPVDATAPRQSLSEPQTELEAALMALRQQIEENSDYVGMNFVAEARRIHDGDAPARAIHGEAKPEEARKLIEDGVPVAPLPFLPGRKVN